MRYIYIYISYNQQISHHYQSCNLPYVLNLSNDYKHNIFETWQLVDVITVSIFTIQCVINIYYSVDSCRFISLFSLSLKRYNKAI